MTSFADAALAATARMRALFPPTPLLRNDHLSDRFGAEIWLKREDLSPVRSYKIRGAFNAMRKVRAAEPTQTRFVCASAGNHAQGMAFACRHFGVHGTIFMPVTTPQQKIDKTRIFGGDQVRIRLTGDYFDQTLAAATDVSFQVHSVAATHELTLRSLQLLADEVAPRLGLSTGPEAADALRHAHRPLVTARPGDAPREIS